MKIRTGFGYDVHKLEDGAPFWLGGIVIEHSKGAVGHSDADVLIHAICDALLGAANKRDIGYHFPDNDPGLKGIDSKILLKDVLKLIRDDGFEVGNIDATIALQTPKINPYIPEMIATLTTTMRISEDDLSIKATTTEKLGFVGNQDGVAAYASVLIQKV